MRGVAGDAVNVVSGREKFNAQKLIPLQSGRVDVLVRRCGSVVFAWFLSPMAGLRNLIEYIDPDAAAGDYVPAMTLRVVDDPSGHVFALECYSPRGEGGTIAVSERFVIPADVISMLSAHGWVELFLLEGPKAKRSITWRQVIELHTMALLRFPRGRFAAEIDRCDANHWPDERHSQL